MEKSTKKKLIIIGALLVIGGVVAYIVVKKPFKKGQGTDTDSPPAGGEYDTSSIPASDLSDPNVAPVTAPEDPRVKSFADVKKFFGSKAKDYVSYIEGQLDVNGKPRLFRFKNDGVYTVHVWMTKSPETKPRWHKMIHGTYTNGGRNLLVKSGKRAGQSIKKSDPISALYANIK